MEKSRVTEAEEGENRRIHYCQYAPEWAEHARFDDMGEPCDDSRTGRICGYREGEDPCPLPYGT